MTTDEPEAEIDRLDLRLVPAALAAWAVTATGIVWGVGGSALAVVAATGVLAGLTRFGGRRFGIAAVLAVAAAGAGFAVAVGLRVHQQQHHPITARYGGAATVVVTATETPRVIAGGRLMFRGALAELDGRPVAGRVMVFAPAGGYTEMTVGRPARFRAAIGRPTRRDLTVAVLTASGRPVLGQASAVQRAAQRVRAGFAESARAALPVDQAAMLPALALGDTSTVDAQTTAQFRVAGLTHLTAVSGANVTIVCGALLLTAGLVGPRVAVGVAALGLIGFVVVVQPSASVLRAAVMGAVTLFAVLIHRRRRAIPALAASVIVLMVAAPELAVDAGFALSVAATAGIVVLAPPWTRRLMARGWPRAPAAAVSVAAVAQLVTAPLVAGISGTFSLVAVAANLAVAAVIPPITVLGTAAALIATVWPAAAQLLIRFTGPELWWLLSVARWASAVPGAAVPTPSGWAGVAVVAAGGAALVIAWRWRWVRRTAAGLAVCALAWTLADALQA
ncbi:competence protein [Mycobacterium dioxanotrophicus]|uniref:Competence protein n=1 Tax=Mycobacterium dioxanotrophicus TaxID=482462 RepID=A0A1Y0C207_9MYCO|nr:ComEC/Rec2 family competence protein [Mycobacterium dioxanotrophicus]ART69219.1 competence protein [Mycobacterium dioxanotrophicus]